MKLLHLSDLHFGKLLFQYSMLPDQRHWCGQVLDFLKQNPHDGVILSGDLYDRSVPPAEAVELMDQFLTSLAGELAIPVLAVSGNHDGGPRLSFASGLYRASGLFLAAMPKPQIEIVTLQDEYGAVDFWLLPYITPADARNCFPDREIHSWNDAYRVFLDENRSRKSGNRAVLVAHGFFSALSAGVDSTAITSDSEVTIGGLDLTDAGLFADFDYCAFGHLHAPQRVGGERMRYSGSPLRYSVSEEHQTKALLSVTLDGAGEVAVAQTELPPLHRLYSVSGTLDQLAAPTGGGVVSNDYVFVNIQTQGTELAAAERVRALYPNYLGIRYHNAAEQELLLGGGEAMRKQSMSDAFTDFYQAVTDRELSPAGVALAQAAAAASQREEEGLQR